MLERIIILDFGSQTTQHIARQLREFGVYCEIFPYNKFPEDCTDIKGVILSGSPYSIHSENAFKFDIANIRNRFPLLGICYGAQLIAHALGGLIKPTDENETPVNISQLDSNNELLKNICADLQKRELHKDSITKVPDNFNIIAKAGENVAAYQINNEKTWGIQFSAISTQILKNFINICECKCNWTPSLFIEATINELKQQLGNDKVVLGLSGGVDSSVTAVLLDRAIGKNLTCIFVDTGLLRKNEFETVLEHYKQLGLNVIGVDAKDKFYKSLAGITAPEQKRKIIGKNFIDVFDEEAAKLQDVRWLGQGTIYPDIIESMSVTGTTIKSHHNVGGLPDHMKLKLVEPLKLLFKDEVRRVGCELKMPENLINRHPFPGPGLGVRILGEITPEKVRILQAADDIYINLLRQHNLYNYVWQACTILLPVRSVGIKNDKRTYENVIALRAIHSTDAMTADWAELPYGFLAEVSNDIINKVEGVNRVVYDISSKPPATIEWE